MLRLREWQRSRWNTHVVFLKVSSEIDHLQMTFESVSGVVWLIGVLMDSVFDDSLMLHGALYSNGLFARA